MALAPSPETLESLRKVREALHAEFASLPADVVALRFEAVSAAILNEARVGDFVPLFVHRYAREGLLEAG